MDEVTQSSERVTLAKLIEEFGEQEARQALGLYAPTVRSGEMAYVTNMLNAHMSAIDGIYSAAWDCEDVDRLIAWHSDQAKVLVAKLRRMGFGDRSSTSYARHSALLRWYADHDNDAHDILLLIQAEQALHERLTLPEDSPLRQRDNGWIEDFWAGVDADEADRTERREAAAQVMDRQKQLAAALENLRTPGQPH